MKTETQHIFSIHLLWAIFLPLFVVSVYAYVGRLYLSDHITNPALAELDNVSFQAK